MGLTPRSALVLCAPDPANLLQCSWRQDYGNGSTVVDDFNAAQRRDAVKESAEVVFCPTSIPASCFGYLAKICLGPQGVPQLPFGRPRSRAQRG